MGYTRYWGFGKKVDKKAYKSALKDIGTMVKANMDVLADGGGEGKPIVKANEIVFNGKDEDSHETFALDSKMKGDFCKTARKPYDEFVGASLLILKDYLGDQVDIDSDGSEGDDGKAMAKKYSKAKPDLKLVKNESYNLNNDFALINECVSDIQNDSSELGFARDAHSKRFIKEGKALNEEKEAKVKKLQVLLNKISFGKDKKKDVSKESKEAQKLMDKIEKAKEISPNDIKSLKARTEKVLSKEVKEVTEAKMLNIMKHYKAMEKALDGLEKDLESGKEIDGHTQKDSSLIDSVKDKFRRAFHV